MFDYIFNLISNVIFESWQVLGQMSPYLLFGFLDGGHAFDLVFAGVDRAAFGRPGIRPGAEGVALGRAACRFVRAA